MALCERFNISPFELRRERFNEVILLINRLTRHTQIERRNYKKVRQPDGSYKTVKKVYASDSENI